MKKVDKSLEIQPLPLGNPSGPGDSRYPVFHYEGPADLDLPKSGVMVIVYKELESNHIERDGKVWYRCDVEVRHIKSAEALKEEQAPAKRDTGTEAALDKLMAEHEAAEGEDRDNDDY